MRYRGRLAAFSDKGWKGFPRGSEDARKSLDESRADVVADEGDVPGVAGVTGAAGRRAGRGLASAETTLRAAHVGNFWLLRFAPHRAPLQGWWGATIPGPPGREGGGRGSRERMFRV